MENFPQTNFPQNEELRGGQHEGMEGGGLVASRGRNDLCLLNTSYGTTINP